MSLDCRAAVMDSSKGEGKRLLRTLELKAFRSVVDALRAQGSFTSRKCSVLKNLASTLKVGDDRCRSEMRRAVNDNLLKYIAQCSEEHNSDEKWRLESARKVARVPMVNEPTVFTALADKVSNWVLSHNRNFVEHDSTLIDIIESKKSRTEGNATRYHSAKLFRPLLTTSSRDAEQIAIELEKIKSLSKLLGKKIHSTKEDCSTVTKPKEQHLQVENPKILDTPSENVQPQEYVDIESCPMDVIVDSCPPKEIVEVKSTVSKKSRAAKSRSRSKQKRSQPQKTCSLQEELSRTVSAVNALVTPVSEPSGASKRPNNSLNVTDEWQPKEKKSKIEVSKKVLSDDEVGKSIAAGARVDQTKSSVVSKSGDNDLSICESYQTDVSMADVSPEMNPLSHKSNVKSTPENAGVPLDKDFAPHTFNLIPASRRLKMVKKKENSNGSVLVNEQELVVSTDIRGVQNASSLIILETNFAENKSVNQSKASGVFQVNDSVSSSSNVIKSGKVSSKVLQLERKKESDEKLKHVLPVLSQSKKTLSLLGNIKVRNLNANAEDESPADSLSSSKSKNKVGAGMRIEVDDELAESEFDQSDIESGSVDSMEYSTFDDSDSHSIIEYWDHEDDEDIIENGNNAGSADEAIEKGNSVKSKVTDDDKLRNHQADLSDEISARSESSAETIVEEIFDDEEFLSDVGDGYESGDTEKFVLDSEESANSSSEEENCDKIKPTICVEQPTIRKLIPKVTASNASAPRVGTVISHSFATNILNNQKSDTKVETNAPTKIGTAVSILKLRKPLAVGPSAELVKAKEVVIVSPNMQKTVSINMKNEKSPASPKFQVIPPSQCIVRGQTISLANARLIKAAPNKNQSTSVTPEVNSALPKITVFSAAKVPTSTGLPLSSSVSKRVTLPQSTKSTTITIPSVKETPLKPSTMSLPKKVCRLYNLMDVSESSSSNSSPKPGSKKNPPNKKPSVGVSSS